MNGIDVSPDDVSPDTAALKDLDPPRDVNRSTDQDGSDAPPPTARRR